ncbi:fam-g protein [Rhizophagus clarus]|uniref:Fam-g protein n=1 Tax=Rhizophagus clarus TaxID=94130 RepID=A0A8H3KQN3_9GLOM|nr:fam-g protein [Rhizophagus clarus]
MPSVDNSQQNSNQLHLKYQPPSLVQTSFSWSQWGSHACIAGSFDPPKPFWGPIEMSKNENNTFDVTLDLIPNKKYYYKFVIDGQWVLDNTKPSCPDEHGNYNNVIEVELPSPPPLPSEEQNVDEEQKIEILESEVSQKEHHENQVVDEDQELHRQNLKEQVEADIQKEQHQHKEIHHEKEQVLSGIKTEQHEDTNDKKEHYKHHDDQVPVTTDDQKVQHLHDDDRIMHQHVVTSDNQEKAEQIEEVHDESTVTEEITESENKETEQAEELTVTEEITEEIAESEDKETEQIEEVHVVSTVTEEITESENKETEQIEELHVVSTVTEEITESEDKKTEQIEEGHVESTITEEITESENKETEQAEELHVVSTVTEEITESEDKKTEQIEEGHVESTITEEITESENKETEQAEELHVVSTVTEEITASEDKETEQIEEVHVELTVTEEVTEEITESEDKEPEQIVDESTVTEVGAVQTEQSRDNSVITEESLIPGIETISSVSVAKEITFEENLSAETVANNESIIEKTPDVVIDDETSKESQYTSSTSHDDSMNPVISTIEKDVNIIDEVTKEEMTSSNQDGGITSTDSEISDVNVEGLSNEFKVHGDISEQSAVVEDDSINESKVTEFVKEKPSINEKHEQDITNKDILISDTTTNVDSELESGTYSTDAKMPTPDVNYEETYDEPELDPIDENEDDNYDDDNYDDDNYDDDYDDDNYDDGYYNEDDNGKGDNKNENNNNEYLNYEDISKETCSEGVSPEAIKEVILNHTWAKDESIDETIPSAWLEPYESTAYVWSEDTQAEWLGISDKELEQKQVTSAWTSSEENIETHKSELIIRETYSNDDEIKSHEISSTSLVEETVTEQIVISSSTIVNENPEEVKVVVAEPPSVQYEKPESSATADEEVSPANDQDVINADVLKDKLKLIEKQENFEEPVNIPASNISGQPTNTSREIVTQTKETRSTKSKNKPPREITSRDVLNKDPKFVKQHDNLEKLDFSIVYLIEEINDDINDDIRWANLFFFFVDILG